MNDFTNGAALTPEPSLAAGPASPSPMSPAIVNPFASATVPSPATFFDEQHARATPPVPPAGLQGGAAAAGEASPPPRQNGECTLQSEDES
jgi:hypothetical protein